MKPIQSSKQLIEKAVEIARQGRKKRVAVAAAHDPGVIGAVAQSAADGFLEGTLFGDSGLIRKLFFQEGVDVSNLEIIDEKDITRAAHRAVESASRGDADIVMKGFLPTSVFLKVVLDKEYNLRGRNTLSHCAVLEIPGYHKLLNLTDGGVVVKPDSEQKFQILENAVLVGRALGLSPVKVAVSAAYDRPSEKLSHAFSDMDFIIPEAMSKLKDVFIQGPLPFDLATSKAVADPQQSEGPVVGDADIYLVDSLEECNIVVKSLTQFAEAVFAGVIVGARVPVSLVSRTNTMADKKASLALACVLSDYCVRHNIFEKGNSRYA